MGASALSDKERPKGRSIIGFFSGKNCIGPADAPKLIQQLGRKTTILSDSGSKQGSPQGYGRLRLEGECVVVTRVDGKDLTWAIDLLHTAGADSIFLAPDDPLGTEEMAAAGAEDPVGEDTALDPILQREWPTLSSAINYLRESARLGHSASPAAQWFLDNAHLLRSETAETRKDLPKEYRKHLGPRGAHLLALAQTAIRDANYHLTDALITEFLRDAQTRVPLAIAQLWAFPLFLRIALIAELRAIAVRASRVQQLREAAYLWADRLVASSRRGQKDLDEILKRLDAEELAGDRSFATSLAEQLQDEEVPLSAVQPKLEALIGASLTDMVRAEHGREAADATSAANAFGSLRELQRVEFRTIFEAVSLTEAELRLDPTAIYSHSDATTRDQCRKRVELLARSSGLKEPEIARAAVTLAAEGADPGHRTVLRYLIGDEIVRLEQSVHAAPSVREGIARRVRAHAMFTYLGSILGLSVAFTAVATLLARESGIRNPLFLLPLAALAVFPLSELSIQIVHSFVISLLPPRTLPKMDFEEGIPDDSATLVAIPIMLNDASDIVRELEKLETRFLANAEPNLSYALLSDFTDAAKATMPADAALLETARKGIADLNSRYTGKRFLLFHRSRTWSETEQKWIGKERKRGKIEELNSFLCGEGFTQLLIEGTLPVAIRFVITLDADTQLPLGVALRMVETISHPLNRVELDPETGIRRSGFGIIQPRVGIALPGATATRFTRIFSDSSGTDPYCVAVSDAQQDLFGEAIFHGKAIYDVRAFRTAVGHRFPAERILSHDLIEGAYAGVALASDIELLENLPLAYPSYAKRQHRWTRGDWQIAEWALGTVPGPDGGRVRNALSLLNRWRIFDNLRRSLVPVASILLLIFGWFLSAAPQVWSLVLGLAVVIPTLAPLLDRWSRHVDGTAYGWQGAADDLVRSVVLLAFLPHQAWLAADAICRSLYRSLISKRNLLEWQTADHAENKGKSHLADTTRQMIIVSGASAIGLVALSVKGAFAPTSLFLALWIASPGIMTWLGREGRVARKKPLGRGEIRQLRRLARSTWRFFDDLVGPDSHWLPPDNSQLALRVEVAQRTSPTNIGLWLTSAIAAHDFGYLTTDGFVQRTGETLATLEKLEKYEGHLLNWYDTKSLEPLQPRYISTVDSGNLIACLWVLARGCSEMIDAPVLPSSCLEALASTLDSLRAVGGSDLSVAASLHGLGPLLSSEADALQLIGLLRVAGHTAAQLRNAPLWSTTGSSEISYWASRLAGELDAWNQAADKYLRWKEVLTRVPDALVNLVGADAVRMRRDAAETKVALKQLAAGPLAPVQALLDAKANPELSPEARGWLVDLERECGASQRAASETVKNLRNIAATAQRIASAINMRFLYDPSRRLLGVGYALGDPVKFTSHYDLLASECRLASLVCIAKGDLPFLHWFALGRPRVSIPSRQALLSWSGTMFEYLMPLLFTHSYDNSLLDRACREAVDCHISYGKSHDIPWGISESAYGALDGNQIYQYRAFGVPALALNPNQEAGPVVAPYATMLALMVDPKQAVDNMDRLESAGLSGPMGFYESIDYTRQSAKAAKPGVVVFTYMAHHQGMSLLALANAINGNAMQRRFHDDVRIRAVESLLFERVPIARLEVEEAAEPQTGAPIVLEQAQDMVFKVDTPLPHVHLNSNGRYSLMITNAGGGYSRWGDFDITRWRADTTCDSLGTFIWCRDLRSGTTWSCTRQPGPELANDAADASVSFAPDHAEFRRKSQDIETVVHVTVATDDDAEVRRLTLVNRSLRKRRVEITTYAELALAAHDADVAHPAFAKLFIETEALDEKALLAHRRPRSSEESPIWAACLLLSESEEETGYETDRRAFLGRRHDLRSPVALRSRLSGTTGTVIDPIFSFRCLCSLEPLERTEITIVTMAAASRDALVAMIEKYRRHGSVARTFEMAWTRAQLEFRFLGIGPASAHRFQEVAGYLLYPNPKLRTAPKRLDRNRLGQSSLWRYGISGDMPIALVSIADSRGLPLVRELIHAHTFWRLRGLQIDLTVINMETPSYELPLRQTLTRLIQAYAGNSGIDKPGGVYLRDWASISEIDRDLLMASAAVVFGGHRGPLQQQLPGTGDAPTVQLPADVPQLPDPRAELPYIERTYFNGFGGFYADGREYSIDITPGTPTPTPWANVIANEGFGTFVSESGLGFTWCGNSQANRLTPWHNDPVSDPQSEAIYLQDADTGIVWSPTPLPVRTDALFRVRHGQGYTAFEHASHGITHELMVFVPRHDPVKVCRLRMRNTSGRDRNLRLTYFAEWVLGSVREKQQTHVSTSWDQQTGTLMARQWWSETYSRRVAFASVSPRASSYSGDRTSSVGRNGSISRPAFTGRPELDNVVGGGYDPCAALRLQIAIPAGETRDVVFLLGEAESTEAVQTLVSRFAQPNEAEAAVHDVREWWNHSLDAVQVKTPVLSIDLILNRWLLYQSLSCRFWARSATYQSGGAFGFRDQLQDCIAFLHFAPEITRAHILLAASRQFPEGDVQHWWHADSGVGVRTLCSDDLLWLPWAVARYVESTGDRGVLDEKVSFIQGPALGAGEHEKMFVPQSSDLATSLWDHCSKAIEHGSRFGGHGLPLFGNGDWNDGMNLVGAEGRGESVWLAWFLIGVLDDFSGVARERGDSVSESLWSLRATALRNSVEEHAWDGAWYLRGFFDDGSPLGSAKNAEAKIDSLPQSWAVIARGKDPQRAATAMASAEEFLVRPKDSLVCLFTPPFDKSEPHPGYIMGYPPGMRENGGQYTHGSLWMAKARAQMGDGDSAVRLLQMMSPVECASTRIRAEKYRGEPYAVAADVSSSAAHAGMAGWTWYTGSAGWMYRIWLEDVLGFQVRGNLLYVKPAIPKDWEGFSIRYRFHSSVYEIAVARTGAGIECDGVAISGAALELLDDGKTHVVRVAIGQGDGISRSG